MTWVSGRGVGDVVGMSGKGDLPRKRRFCWATGRSELYPRGSRSPRKRGEIPSLVVTY